MNKERLSKLADHLLYGELVHKKFTLSVFNSNLPDGYTGFEEDNICGTYGCAIGECPAVFPGDWVFNANGGLTLITSNFEKFNHTTDDYAMEFFGLIWDEYTYLFYPGFYKKEEVIDKMVVANRILSVIENGFPKKFYE